MARKDAQDGINPARGRKSLAVGAEHLILAIRTIIEDGREEEFVAACRKADVSLKVPPATINFLKRFVAAQTGATGDPLAKSLPKAMSPAARKVADCDECQ